MNDLTRQYVEKFKENVAIYAIPEKIEIDGKEYTYDEFLKLCIQENKLVTDYFPYQEDCDY